MCGPVIKIDLTATVEHLYGGCRLLLWLGWGGIRCRGRRGHRLLSDRNQIRSAIIDTGSHGPFDRSSSAPFKRFKDRE